MKTVWFKGQDIRVDGGIWLLLNPTRSEGKFLYLGCSTGSFSQGERNRLRFDPAFMFYEPKNIIKQ